jgi:hypothetical protein
VSEPCIPLLASVVVCAPEHLDQDALLNGMWQQWEVIVLAKPQIPTA